MNYTWKLVILHLLYICIYIHSIKLLKATFTNYYDINAIVNN